MLELHPVRGMWSPGSRPKPSVQVVTRLQLLLSVQQKEKVIPVLQNLPRELAIHRCQSVARPGGAPQGEHDQVLHLQPVDPREVRLDPLERLGAEVADPESAAELVQQGNRATLAILLPRLPGAEANGIRQADRGGHLGRGQERLLHARVLGGVRRVDQVVLSPPDQVPDVLRPDLQAT